MNEPANNGLLACVAPLKPDVQVQTLNTIVLLLSRVDSDQTPTQAYIKSIERHAVDKAIIETSKV